MIYLHILLTSNFLFQINFCPFCQITLSPTHIFQNHSGVIIPLLRCQGIFGCCSFWGPHVCNSHFRIKLWWLLSFWRVSYSCLSLVFFFSSAQNTVCPLLCWNALSRSFICGLPPVLIMVSSLTFILWPPKSPLPNQSRPVNSTLDQISIIWSIQYNKKYV